MTHSGGLDTYRPGTTRSDTRRASGPEAGASPAPTREAHGGSPATTGTSRERPDEIDAIVEQWRVERPDLDPEPINVLGRVARCAAILRTLNNRTYEQSGLTAASFDVLANLRRSGPPHRKTAGELATSSLLTSGGITFRLDRMEAEGLIRRFRSGEDRRVVYAELTPTGLQVIDELIGIHLAREQTMVGQLTRHERHQLTELLRKLEHSLTASSVVARPNTSVDLTEAS